MPAPDHEKLHYDFLEDLMHTILHSRGTPIKGHLRTKAIKNATPSIYHKSVPSAVTDSKSALERLQDSLLTSEEE